MKAIAIGIVAVMLTAAAQSGGEAERLFSAAKNTETVDGNLQSAIKQYNAIVSKYGKSDRPVAAMALVRMAECYQKMGDTQAEKIFQRVIREYAEQKEAVALASASLGRNAMVGPVTRRVWIGPKADNFQRVTPDGRHILYVNSETGALVLRDLETGADRDLVPDPKHAQMDDEGFDTAVSRDGKQVAYSWSTEKGWEVRVGLEGNGAPRRLYSLDDLDYLSVRDWSPDGKWISADIWFQDRTVQRALLSVADGSVRVLKTVKAAQMSGGGENGIHFSPDSRYVAYGLYMEDRMQLFVQPVDGSPEVSAAAYRGVNQIMGWLSDGRLLFLNDRTGDMSLSAILISEGKPQGEPALLTALGPAEPLGLSTAGTLFYSPSRPRYDGPHVLVTALDPVSGKPLSAPRDITQGEASNSTQPVWSPDGTLLAYLSRKLIYPMSWFPQLLVRSADNGRVVRALSVQMRALQLRAWTPDGSAFIVQGQDFDGNPGMFRIDALSGALTPIAMGRETANAAVSLDGKTLYLRTTVPKSSDVIFTARDLASGAEQQVIRRADLGQINLSPDGRFIATACSDPATNSRVLLLIPTGGGEPRVTMSVPSLLPKPGPPYTEGQSLLNPVWTSDSRSFYFRKRPVDKNQPDELWRARVEGGDPVKLEVTLDRTAAGVTGFAISPHGNRLAAPVVKLFPKSDQEVWVVENIMGAPGRDR